MSNDTSGQKRRGRKPKGLGDAVEAITKATGIKAAVDWFSEQTGIDCGCEARKEKLNNLFKGRKKPNCLTKQQYEAIRKLDHITNQIPAADSNSIAHLHAQVFQHKVEKPCSCNPKVWFTWLSELRSVAQTYEEETTS